MVHINQIIGLYSTIRGPKHQLFLLSLVKIKKIRLSSTMESMGQDSVNLAYLNY